MKKLLALILTLCLFTTLNIEFYAKTVVDMPDATIIINGETLEVPIPPANLEGSMLVPFRAIFEALKMGVHYDENTKTITAIGNSGATTLVMTLNDENAFINDIGVIMEIPPFVVEGSTLVPLRFVGEILDATVNWSDSERTVYITKSFEVPPVVTPDPEPGTTPDDLYPPVPDGLNNLILGESEVSLEVAKEWAASKRASQYFIDAADYYWQYGAITGIRPEVLYAQSAKETGFGKYGGIVTIDMNNFAGIKTASAVGDLKEEHESFATMEDGVRGHFNHMSAYLGLTPVGSPVHDRYYVVARLEWAGTIRTVEELGARWAPDSGYGESILNSYISPMIEMQLEYVASLQ